MHELRKTHTFSGYAVGTLWRIYGALLNKKFLPDQRSLRKILASCMAQESFSLISPKASAAFSQPSGNLSKSPDLQV